MKNYIVPILAFLSIITHAFINSFTIAHAIAFIPFCGLLGFYMYIEYSKRPNYEQIFEDRLKDMGKAVDGKFKLLEKEYKELKDNYGKVTIEQSKKKSSSLDNFSF